MTRKEKLKELGYTSIGENFAFRMGMNCSMNMEFICKTYYLDEFQEIYTQEQLDSIQRCFNNLKHDFEEVMKLED